MAGADEPDRSGTIDAASLELVCADFPCAAFTPEG
jgi:hypothetical protein